MKSSKIIIIILMLLSILGTLVIYPTLPEEVPLHWDARGEIDRIGSKTNLFMTAFLPVVIYLLMIVIPKLDPKKQSYQKHEKAYNITMLVSTIFMIGIHWITILVSLGYEINASFVVKIALGILFTVMGNYMTQIRQNYLFGIRTPWTLANEIVWKKTHRFGGYGFMLSGIVFLAASFIKGSIGLIAPIAVLMALIVVIFVYSYIIFKKLN